jgi:predicted acylesterase/phospholipase RssA
MRVSLTILALVGASQASDDEYCRALVLSGGANNGVWESGVIWGLVHYGDPTDYKWDVVSGVSAGAINSAGIALWELGTEVEMSEWLSTTYEYITTEDIWTMQPGGPVYNLFNGPSLADDTPALNTITQIVNSRPEGIKRPFVTSAVNVETGDYETFTEENVTVDELPKAALASGSIPVIFPPMHLHGMILMDGGTVWNANVNTAV